MNAKRIRLVTILGGILVSGLTLIAWTQLWVTVTIENGPVLDVGGDVAAPALSTLALSGLALAAALTVAGPVFRVVLGVLQAALGGLVIYSGASAVGDPVASAAPAITDATGVSGAESIARLATGVSPTAWPAITIVLGVLLVLLGIGLLVTSRLWPVSGRKYQAVRLEGADEVDDTVGEWDALSRGKDPT